MDDDDGTIYDLKLKVERFPLHIIIIACAKRERLQYCKKVLYITVLLLCFVIGTFRMYYYTQSNKRKEKQHYLNPFPVVFSTLVIIV